MPPKKRAAKPIDKNPEWKRYALVLSGLVFSFALGLIAGMRQHWVEGNHVHGGAANEQYQVRELANGQVVRHGPYELRYPEGSAIKESGDYFLGQKHGPWLEFYPDGKLKSRNVYVDGALQDGSKEWDENGAEIQKKPLP